MDKEKFRDEILTAIMTFRKRHPILYKANIKFFNEIIEKANSGELYEEWRLLRRLRPKRRRTLKIFTDNRLSRWTSIVLRINSDGEVRVHREYKPEKGYSYTWYIPQGIGEKERKFKIPKGVKVV